MTVTSIALNKLVPWQGNVRKTAVDENIGELVESIAAHSLLQPLVVRKAPRGKFAVVAGQRRLMAMNILAKAGRLPADHHIDCHPVADDADATEISLAENVVRADMHPADEFEAWRGLIDRGATALDVAARFGVSETTVTKRMKLGRVAPALLDLYRQGEMSLDQVMAFTLSDDHAAQMKIWNEAGGDWQRSASLIRKALTRDEVPATDKRVRFVTLEAYEAAGGTVRRDLFDDKNSGYVADTILLDRLVEEGLAQAYETAMFEGWKWVEVRPDFPYEQRHEFKQGRPECIDLSEADEGEYERLEEEEGRIVALCEEEDRDQLPEEQDRLDHIERLKEAIDERRYAYSPETKACSGVVITLTPEGHPEIERGLIRPGDARKGAKAAQKKKSPFSAALLTSLRDHKAVAVAAELAANPHVALAAVTHDLALKAFYPGAQRYCGGYLTTLSADEIARPDDSKAAKHLEKLRKKFDRRLPDNKRDLWAFLLDQEDAALMDILAFCAAPAINTASMDTLVDALEMDCRSWFTPTAINYFSRLGKTAILADIADMGESLTGRTHYAKLKKGELAKAAEAVAGREGNEAWLPIPMRPKSPGVSTADEDDELTDVDEYEYHGELDEAA